LDANTNDVVMPAFLLVGFWLSTSGWARGAAVALSGWTKFASLLVAPLWATYPALELRRTARFLAGFGVATVLAFAILALEPSLWGAVRTFWERTIEYQSARIPRSRSGLGPVPRVASPTSASRSRSSRCCRLARGRRRVRPAPQGQCGAALTAAVLVAFQLTLTHWSTSISLGRPVRVPVAPAAEPAADQETATRTASIPEALPVSASQVTTAPSMRTP
jgi:hypothetical protein